MSNTDKGGGQQLMLMLPRNLRQQLKEQAAKRNVTMRVIVLEALCMAGFDVPAEEMRDRRMIEEAP